MSIKGLPASFRKLVCQKISPLFRDAVSVITEPLKKPDPKQIIVQNRFVGINASDINMTAGRYLTSNRKVPFSLGLEGLGEIVCVGDTVKELKVGQTVMYMGDNVAFAEYVYLSQADVIPIPAVKPEFIPLLISGTTASLSLDMCGRINPGDKVLITAAAGGTGHLAVQWAKHAGCHVIGLCSSPEKVEFLKNIGCDRCINYKTENLSSVLKAEYPEGIDVVWESIGGEIFKTLFENLRVKGRLIIVGAISTYKDNFTSTVTIENLPMKLLLKSLTLSGFLLTDYQKEIPHYLSLLIRLVNEQILHVHVDKGDQTPEGVFNGIGDIVRAVEYLHGGKNRGKVVVAL